MVEKDPEETVGLTELKMVNRRKFWYLNRGRRKV